MLVESTNMTMPDPDFAPDLEWMLQSGQVSRDLLLEALILEFYAPVFYLALALLDDQRAAQRAAYETFSRSLVEIHHYRHADGVSIWLFRIALGVCRNFDASLKTRRSLKASLPFLGISHSLGDSLPDNPQDAEIWLAFDQLDLPARQSVNLHFLLNWDVAHIAALLNEPSQDVQLRIRDAVHFVLESLSHSQIHPFSTSSESAAQDDDEIHAELLKSSLLRRWSYPEISQTNLDRTIAQIARRSSLIGSRRRSVISFLEIAMITVIILIGVGLVWGLGRFETIETPTPTASPAVQTVLVTHIVDRYVTATPRPLQPLQESARSVIRIPRESFKYVRPGESLTDLAERLGFSPEELQELNRIPDRERLKSGQRILLPSYWSNPVPTSLNPVPKISPAPLLEEPILSESILRRLAVQGPQFSTLWLDARIIDNGPLSYIGPPRQLRFQSWFSPSQSLALIGNLNSLPREVFLHLDDSVYSAQPSLDDPWFSEWRLVEHNNSTYRDVLNRFALLIFDTRELERGYTFKAIGRESQAGVESLVFDVYDRDEVLTDRIWYDESRGLILRRIVFADPTGEQSDYEVSLEQVAYDVEFPQDIFDPRLPWRGGFSADNQGAPAPIKGQRVRYTNGRTRMTRLSPPSGFDPASSRLSFQFTPSFSVESPAGWIELFADDVFLGEMRFGNPWQSICDRSPDGTWLAFVSKPVHEDNSNSFLQWFNLHQPDSTFATLSTHFGVTEFAFSPDSSKIAYFGRPSRLGMGTLGIIETATQKDQTLMTMGDVKSLVWNPDGESFAMIARYEPNQYDDFVAVYDLNKGKITYSAAVDYESNAFQDWPMLDWGVEFPVEMGGMDSCAASAQTK